MLILALLLACSDPAPAPPTAPPAASPPPPAATQTAPAATPAWVAEAVAEALLAEIQPGTSGEPAPGREVALTAFFVAHPEYANAEKRQLLYKDACYDGIETAHARLVSPPPRTPFVLNPPAGDWRVVVIHADGLCTSDDFAWYTAEVGQAMVPLGVMVEGASADNDVLVVQIDGVEVARAPLHAAGYTALRPGKEPLQVDHDASSAVVEALKAYFELP